jgi:hypothetical protein
LFSTASSLVRNAAYRLRVTNRATPGAQLNSRTRSSWILRIAAVAAILGAAWLGFTQWAAWSGPQGKVSDDEALQAASEEWQTMFDREERIAAVTPILNELAFAVTNLALPDDRTRLHFDDVVSVSDWAEGQWETISEIPHLGIVSQRAHLGAKESVPRDRIALWRAFLADVAYFHQASFSAVSGQLAVARPRGQEIFELEVLFAGVAAMRNGKVVSLSTKQRLRFQNLQSDSDPRWMIVSWESLEGEQRLASAFLFEEVLDSAIPDLAERSRARESVHERMVSEYLADKAVVGRAAARPHRWFRMYAWDRHPGLAVVDLDRDGFDDLYVMARWGPNQFLRNRGDGTFEEIAAELGIDVVDHSSSAIFADFDNDGDADLFLGRTLERSRYFENDDGHFRDRSEYALEEGLPYLASSVSAVDYDADGLLDIYVSTYGNDVYQTVARKVKPATYGVEALLNADYPFVPKGDLEILWRLMRAPDWDGFLNFPGPRNVLLHNVGGGRFEWIQETPLDVWRNTFQTSWSDYDNDGDQDAYLANDFAPDVLIRNEGGGRFSDVSEEVMTGEIGLAMGASWGDYDRDGRQDIYVTNMYSKAGSRITETLGHLEDGYREAAAGNRLLRNEGGRFKRVSGHGSDEHQVAKAGWGWGSIFADVDNDGFLDLHTLSGFYTAPRSVVASADT